MGRWGIVVRKWLVSDGAAEPEPTEKLNHRSLGRIKGEGKAGDNSTIVQAGWGEAPRGRKLALFPCSEAGCWPRPSQGSW